MRCVNKICSLTTENDDVQKSLRYSLKIQESLLPDINSNQKFNGSFSIDNPLQVISGDFYLHKKLTDGRILLAMGDCTGHGIPGSLLSILTITKIGNIIESYKHSEITPSKILYTLNESYKTTVIWDSDRPISDGVEIFFVILGDNTMQYSSGGGSLIIGTDGNFELIKGGRSKINDITGKVACFEDITINKPKYLFMYSDGIHDVFNLQNKKLGKTGLLNCIINSENDSFDTFRENIEQNLKLWYDVVDDNTLIGYKLK